MITLDGITLPGDLAWPDEFTWSPMAQVEAVGVDGALILQHGQRQAGRPITLTSGVDRGAYFAVMQRAEVEALQAIETVGREMVLDMDGRLFDVTWRAFEGPPIEAEPIKIIQPPDPADLYRVILRLITI